MPHKVCASGTLTAGKNRLVNGARNTLWTNFYENFSQEWILPATLLHTTMQHPTISDLGGSFLNHTATLSNPPLLLYPSARGEQCIEVNWSLLSPCWWAAKICRRQANPKQHKTWSAKKVLKFWEPCQVGLKLVWYLVRSHVSTAICLMKLTSLI